MSRHPTASLGKRAILICTLSSCLAVSVAMAQPFSEAASAASAYATGTLAPAQECDALARLSLREVLRLTAELVPATNGAEAYCRVDGTIEPEITFQVNLPVSWNGRFYMIGNGGHAGQQPNSPANDPTRAQALAAHFVMAMTDTGHDAAEEPGASFVMSNPQKAIDYAYRAVHMTAVTSKEIANAYYGQPVQHAYWNSCSNGGRQGLIEAQRFPDDFDGIIANAPWVSQTGFTIGALWNQRAMDAVQLTPAKLDLLASSVMAKCDAVDGLEDGLIGDPRQCNFNALNDIPRCGAGASGGNCLLQSEAEAIQKVYDGPRDSEGRQLFPGYMPGSEAPVTGPNGTASPWLGLIVPAAGGARTGDFNLADNTMRYLAFQPPRPDWDYHTFDFDNDPEQLERWSRLVDASDINLLDFRARGGKLMITYGWADQVLQPLMGVHYYEQAVVANGPDGTDFMRLFMIPGMTHCAGGIGPDQHDPVTAIIDWVETGKAPELLVAKKIVDGETTRSRPLCPYPQVARYDGEGSIDDAANFACKAP
jgi:feruloyl esterase